MTNPNRPYCRAPSECIAKGTGHCKGCNGVAQMAKLVANPDLLAARREKINECRRTPEARARSRANLRQQMKKPGMRKKIATLAKGRMEKLNADPVVRAKAAASLSQTLAARLATRVGIPLALVTEFRDLRQYRVLLSETRSQCRPINEVVEILRARHPEAFKTFDQARRAAAARAAGPMPAIGTPARAVWSRKVNLSSSGREAHPC